MKGAWGAVSGAEETHSSTYCCSPRHFFRLSGYGRASGENLKTEDNPSLGHISSNVSFLSVVNARGKRNYGNGVAIAWKRRSQYRKRPVCVGL